MLHNLTIYSLLLHFCGRLKRSKALLFICLISGGSLMAKIKSRKHIATTPLVALAASLPLASHAATKEEKVTQLPTIEVNAENTYKADKVSSPKYTQPLVDTPQTISVIKKEILKEQGATSLTDALRNTPGITLQLGENGNTSAGDSFQMRGFDTKNSIYVDGIRDIGAISRDVYNLEQIEVVKGPSGAEAGRGGAGGYINLSTKLPHAENSSEVSATYNTAEHSRLAADINQAINESTAVRLNVMGKQGGVEDRDYIEQNGWAIAPAIAFGLDSDTRFYLYSQHIKQNNIPDGGIPTIGMDGFYYGYSSNYEYDSKYPFDSKDKTLRDTIRADINNSADAKKINAALAKASAVDRTNFYGNVNDHEDITANMVSAKIESDLSENIKFTNISRFGKTEMERVLTGVNTITVPSVNVTVNTDKTYSYKFNYKTLDLSNPDTFTVARTRQGLDQTNKILANQSTLNINVKTGDIEHNIVAGLELLQEQQYNKTRNTDGVRWSPDWTASLWTTYSVSGFKAGIGARYVDEQKRLITNSATPVAMPTIPSYVVFDAMAGYSLNKNASVNLNVYNLADKDYISALNNGGSRFVLGQPRSAALTFNYKF